MFFNKLGRKIPTEKCRVFANAERNFYKINDPLIDLEKQNKKAVNLKLLSKSVNLKNIELEQNNLYNSIKNDSNYQNLILGTSIPFAISHQDLPIDIGSQLEDRFLPLIKNVYENAFEGSWFKATLQGQNTLKESIRIVEESGYKNFVKSAMSGCIVGCYFPTAFQEYDIKSQRNQINILPKNENFNICLSGHIETSYSLIMYPNLLFSRKYYSPILCLSALEHEDPRMIPIIKSYGPHLEFWLLSQMMTNSQTQVSEQWSGGITLYRNI